MFDFEYKNIYPELKYDFAIFDQKNKSGEFISNFKNNFKKKGIAIVKINEDNQQDICKQFQEISELIGKNPIRDATRRSSINANKNSSKISTVDPDIIHRPHSETSFSPARPAIIGFVCLEIDNEASDKGLTTIIDGYKIWKDLNIKTKNILLSGEIEYRLSIDTPSGKKYRKGRDHGF